MVNFNSSKLRAAIFLQESRNAMREGDRERAMYCLGRAGDWRGYAMRDYFVRKSVAQFLTESVSPV